MLGIIVNEIKCNCKIIGFVGTSALQSNVRIFAYMHFAIL